MVMRLLVLVLSLAGAACGSSTKSDDAGVGVGDLSLCPAYDPSSGAGAGGACLQPDRLCYYFEAYCHCGLQTHEWFCCGNGAPQLCPSTAPTPGAACCRAYRTPSCDYACVGGVATMCTCTDDHWQCTDSSCD